MGTENLRVRMGGHFNADVHFIADFKPAVLIPSLCLAFEICESHRLYIVFVTIISVFVAYIDSSIRYPYSMTD